MQEDQAIGEPKRRWKIRHCVLMGVALGFVLPAALGIHNWWIRHSILNLPAPDELPDQAADAFQTFKQHLAFHVEGTHVALADEDGVRVIKSPLLAKEFPEFVFFQVKFKWSDAYDCVCAMPLGEGPSWFFNQPRLRLRNLVAFLGWTGRKLRTDDDARTVHRIVGEFTMFDSILTNALEQVTESQWRIGIDRKDDFTWFLEINTDRDGVVESGLLTPRPK